MSSSAFAGMPALPLVPAPAAIRLQSMQRTRVSQAESGKILSRAYGGQYYKATLEYGPIKRSDAASLIAFLQSRQGRDSEFKVELTGFREVPGVQVANFGNYDNDTKLHLITQTSPTLEVYPVARHAGVTFWTDTVYMRASLAHDVQEVNIPRNGLIRLSVDLIERL